MKAFVVLITLVFLTLQEKQMTIQDLKWKNRVVLFFPNQGVDNLIFSDSLKNEIEERKIAYFIFGDSIISNTDINLTPAYIRQVENQYRMGYKDNMYVLLGLDGGVKLKQENVLDWDIIFNTIDAMPMRQSEIKKGSR